MNYPNSYFLNPALIREKVKIQALQDFNLCAFFSDGNGGGRDESSSSGGECGGGGVSTSKESKGEGGQKGSEKKDSDAAINNENKVGEKSLEDPSKSKRTQGSFHGPNGAGGTVDPAEQINPESPGSEISSADSCKEVSVFLVLLMFQFGSTFPPNSRPSFVV